MFFKIAREFNPPCAVGSQSVRNLQHRKLMNVRKMVRWSFCALSACCLAARADMVTEWNSVALNAIKADRTSPPHASRALAILHVAIYDACNGISQNNEPYFVTDKPSGVASKEAAISAAAHTALVQLFPGQQAAFDSAFASELEQIADGPGKRVGIAWGESVAKAILQARGSDGSDMVVDYLPGSGVGIWVPTPPALAPALLPNWPALTPFAMIDGSQFRPPSPPGLDTPEWASDFNLTKDLGRRTKQNINRRTAGVLGWSLDQLQTASRAHAGNDQVVVPGSDPYFSRSDSDS